MHKIKDNFGLMIVSLFSIIYLCLICNFIINFDELKTLKLNEKGDVLAGVFSPLAFIWLIYGYLQQGQELRQNSKALKMQADELRISNESLRQQVVEMSKSVKAQQDMFQLAETQYRESNEEKLKGSMPLLSLTGSKYTATTHFGESEYRFTLILKILNQQIKNIKIHSNFWFITQSGGTHDQSKSLSIPTMNFNKSVKIILYIKTNLSPFHNNTLTFDYYDESNKKYSKMYQITKSSDKFVLLDEITTDI